MHMNDDSYGPTPKSPRALLGARPRAGRLSFSPPGGHRLIEERAGRDLAVAAAGEPSHPSAWRSWMNRTLAATGS